MKYYISIKITFDYFYLFYSIIARHKKMLKYKNHTTTNQTTLQDVYKQWF